MNDRKQVLFLTFRLMDFDTASFLSDTSDNMFGHSDNIEQFQAKNYFYESRADPGAMGLLVQQLDGSDDGNVVKSSGKASCRLLSRK